MPDLLDTLLPDQAAAAVKPKLRGWLHAGWTPLAIVAGIVLIFVADTRAGVLGSVVFLAASLLLFGTSAIYHRGTWSPTAMAVLRRMDHANIFVFIAATYTPLALTLLDGTSRVVLLSVVWGAALLGLFFRIFWLSAPRWLYVVLYITMGWVAVFWLPTFWNSGGVAVVVLLIVGGLFYTLGAVVYGRKRPDPAPAWFGYHEIFHAGTIIAFCCHWTSILLAVTSG
ncbi:PAQR family membrane homeostasis protein TrhA [Enemella sp. A6]|uniref:PAQR family membrane homeostasis protein TrhA n=1 Tax=Enemella sp. A6 TaxID=3440152 RepID=UPI003EBC8452